ALKGLEKEPSNPNLNLRAGKFLCLDKSDWTAGLPLLAKSSDMQLRTLARMDLATPTEPNVQGDLGQKYWDWSSHLQGPEKANAQGRAIYWYLKAYPSLAGLAKLSAQ